MLIWRKRVTIHTPTVKRAGLFWGTVLDWLGYGAVYAPNGRIYVSPSELFWNVNIHEWVYDYPRFVKVSRGPRRSWLVEHEKAHHYQRCRDGWLRFWLGITWAYLTVGHAASPYEIEANDIADMAVGW